MVANSSNRKNFHKNVAEFPLDVLYKVVSELDTKIKLYSIELSKYVNYEMGSDLLEATAESFRLANINHALQILSGTEKRFDQNLEKIRNYSPKKELAIIKSIAWTAVIIVSLLIIILITLQIIAGNPDQQSDFFRWVGNISLCGACLIPLFGFLWLVFSPRLINDNNIKKLEIELITDLAVMISVKNMIEKSI